MDRLNHSFFYTHFELGDSIICNGLVRNLLKKIDNITILSKKSIECSVKWMYRDLPNVDFLFFNSYNEANEFEKKENPQPIIKIGFKYISNPIHLEISNLQFDESYYHLINLPFSKRWDDFFVLRDIGREMSFFRRLKLKENQYIFVHDEYSNEKPYTNLNYIENKNLPIIRPNSIYTDNIFDYLYLLENSAEIHCVCSSFKNLIDSLKNINCPLYFHKNRSAFKISKKWVSSCKLPWRHVDYY